MQDAILSQEQAAQLYASATFPAATPTDTLRQAPCDLPLLGQRLDDPDRARYVLQLIANGSGRLPELSRACLEALRPGDTWVVAPRRAPAIYRVVLDAALLGRLQGLSPAADGAYRLEVGGAADGAIEVRGASETVPVPVEEAFVRDLGAQFWDLCARLVLAYPNRPTEPAPTTQPATYCRRLRELSTTIAQELAPSPHWRGDASVGQGWWVAVPWVAFSDRRSSHAAGQGGVYPCVQLLWKDEPGLRLLLNVSADAPDGREQLLGELDPGDLARLRELGFVTADHTSERLQAALARLPRSYRMSAAVEYLAPLDEVWRDPAGLTRRLQALLHAYATWVGRDRVEEEGWDDAQAAGDLRSARAALMVAAQERGLSYAPEVHEAFLLSLKAKPFCLLAGPTGTGKSCLARLLADLGARVHVEPVDPSWSDGRVLIGRQGEKGFQRGILAELAESAAAQPGRLHVLVLDELNLARPERYLARWLSVVESRRLEGGLVVADPLVRLDARRSIPTPANLCVIGTLNMDESDCPIPHRVLDRANVLTLTSPRALLPERAELDLAGEPRHVLGAEAFATLVLTWQDVLDVADPAQSARVEAAIRDVLQPTQDALRRHLSRVRISYRLRDEIAVYLYHGLANGLDEEDDLRRLIDQQLRQRLLPKLLDGHHRLQPALVDDLIRCWEPLGEGPERAAAILRAVADVEAQEERAVSLWNVLA